MVTASTIDLKPPVGWTLEIEFGTARTILGVIPVVAPLADVAAHILDIETALSLGKFIDR